MYTGSLGAASNQADWIVSFQLTDSTNTAQDLTGATFSVFVTDPDTPSTAIISGSTSDGTVATLDNLTITWSFAPTKMNMLPAGDYSVFVRMLMNGITTAILAAQLSVIDGGPSS